jgi:hypothetical protein
MVLALTALAAAGFHDIDESANENNELAAGAAGPVGRALQAVAAADWPAELQSQADELETAIQELADALATDDVEQVKGPAATAHEVQHDFEHAVAEVLNPAVGLPTEEEEHEEESGTPMADETPEGTEEHMEEETPMATETQ